ncbi:helix-turn-helix transcriptional regulator [Roseovarius aestuarii]|uniref:HTH domain protein n=1 Tax=Roseovarius aestuarii TaxID=475083 RepID=A0A1X7BY20_9RHOB|nr:YafY family protein [Roseovarius aestuarii]SMC14514.1 HTH domain protein [Roseovarius aestuarii]
MARSTRMFEIIQLLRNASKPRTAAQIAEELEVTPRTIYRDIASLQAMRVPIDGAAGVGYIMRPGFDLPPINFDIEEAEAVTVGLAMIARTGDRGLQAAGRRACRKLSEATQLSEALFSSTWGPKAPDAIDLSDLRTAIRQERKLCITYVDGHGVGSSRTILPFAIVYHSEAIVLATWCELRNDFRNFRPDRITRYERLEEGFEGKGEALRREWMQSYAEWL